MMRDNSLLILDVGHGNCSVINDQGVISIIDTGRKSTLLEFLENNRIEKIKYLFLSHSDSDHIGGLIALLAEAKIKIEIICLNTDSLKGSDLWDDLLYELGQQKRLKKINTELGVVEGKSYPLPTSTIKVSSPSFYLAAKGPGSSMPSGTKIQSNTLSLLLLLEHAGNNVACFSGDIDALGYSQIPQKVREHLKCQYLVFPHHGGTCKGNFSQFYTELLNDVKPDAIIFSNGRGRFSNPRKEVIDLIKAERKDTVILCTELSEDCSDELPQGMDQSLCCAGEIGIALEADYHIFKPDMGEYNKFKKSITGRLCR